MIPSSSFPGSLFMVRRAEFLSAGRFLLLGAVLHLMAAVAALGFVGDAAASTATHPFVLGAPLVSLFASELAMAIGGLGLLALSVVTVMAAVGIRNHQAWAPRAAVVVAALGVLNAPFGSLVSLLALAHLMPVLADDPDRPPAQSRRLVSRRFRFMRPA